MNTKPEYVYVASSWRNIMQIGVCAALRSAGIDHYDFKNPEGGTGFSWREVKTDVPSVTTIKPKGSDWEEVDEYLRMVEHPRALEGFAAVEGADGPGGVRGEPVHDLLRGVRGAAARLAGRAVAGGAAGEGEEADASPAWAGEAELGAPVPASRRPG